MKIALVGLLMFILLEGALTSCGPLVKIESLFKMTLSEPIKLIVDTGSGDIHIQRGADDQILVQARVFVRALTSEQARELAEKVKGDPPIEILGNTIRIGDLSKYREGSSWFLGPYLSIDFDIHVPYEAEAELDSGSGDQTVSGIRGPVRAEAGSGDIEIASIAREVAVSTGSGNIKVSGAAKVSAKAGSGDVKLSTISGDVTIEVGSGDVVLQEIGGAITASTGSGNIHVDSGLGSSARWQLKASSGDVAIRLPADARFALAVETSSGDIEVDFPLTVTGKLSKRELRGTVGESPSAEISIETSSGDIRIKKQ